MTKADNVKITLLGPIGVQLRNGELASFATQKTIALLGILALSWDTGVHRDLIASMLWSRSNQSQARTNLRQALASLRKSLGDDAEIIVSSGVTLTLRHDLIDCDISVLYDDVEAGASDKLELLLSASTLLLDVSLNEPDFETWLQQERSKYAALLSTVLLKTGEYLIFSDHLSEALRVAQKLVEMDAYYEAAYRLEMRILHLQGETALALRTYERLNKTLLDELSIEPSAESSELFRKISKPIMGSEKGMASLTASVSIESEVKLKNVQQVMEGYNKKISDIAEKPTIAVLPFVNMSDDPEQAFFSDGISEDIVIELSRFSLLSITSWTGSIALQKSGVDFNMLRQKYGIQFVLNGSVRKVGKRVRVTAQLIETDTGNQVWGERYDRDLEDIFQVQDDVTQSIVAVVPGRVAASVVGRARRKPTTNMKAYEFFLKGKSIRDGFSADATISGRWHFEQAIALDPYFARAHCYLADTYFVDFILGLSPPGTEQLIFDIIRIAVQLDGNDVSVQEEMGFAYLTVGMWADASAQFDHAASLVVNEAEQLMWCGYGLMMVGRHEDAVEMVERAIKIDPLHPPSFEWVYGQALFFAGRYEEANKVLKAEALMNSIAYACRVGAFVQLGLMDEARTALSEFIVERQREFKCRDLAYENKTIESYAGGYRVMLQRKEDWDILADGLR